MCRRTQQPDGPVISGEARQRLRCAPAPVVLLVAPAGWTVRTSTGLAFPMDQLAADRIVPISGGGRKMSAGLVEGKRQQIYICIREPTYAFTPFGHLQSCPLTKCSKDLSPGLAGMDVQDRKRVV